MLSRSFFQGTGAPRGPRKHGTRRPRLLASLNRGEETFQAKTLAEGWGIHEMGWVADDAQKGLFLYGADEIQDQRFKDMKTRVNYWPIVPGR